ncbi:MAG TPA: ArsR family transcriptional regulator [Nitrososphaerales archaeon]|nr:ArsR family transcriptional regulator [Nitrososphaerales archaeon]
MDRLSLLGHTKAKILDLLLEKRRTAKEIGDLLDIQISAARKHLESLKEMGFAACDVVSEGVGRPKKYFMLTESGRELYPRQYSNVLSLLIMKLIRKRGALEVEGILNEIAEDLVRQAGQQGNSNQGNYQKLISTLSHLGFDSTLEADENGEEKETVSLITRNCPMLKVASTHQRLICHGLHNHILKSALGTQEINLQNCIASGDNLCRHRIPRSLVLDEAQG